jgi:hypothetical protein
MANHNPASTGRTGHLDMTIMLAFHDAFRRDLGHLARAASRRRSDLQEPARRTAVRTGWRAGLQPAPIRQPLFRRIRRVAGRRWQAPDEPATWGDYGSVAPDVAWHLPALAPRLAP